MQGFHGCENPYMNTDLHCQECGATTRSDRQDDGTEVLICTNDDCPRIIIAAVLPDEGPTGIAAFYSQRSA